MSTLRVIEVELSIQKSSIEECLMEMLNELRSDLEKLVATDIIKGRSQTLRPAIENSASGRGVIKWGKQSIFYGGKSGDKAIYQIDGRGECDGQCGSFHQLNIVLCLNNREVIGTNYLKLEVAAKQELRNHKVHEISDKNIVGVLLTLDRDLLNAGDWDPSYADSSEYTVAYRSAYKSVLQSNVLSLQMHLT